MEKYRLIRDGQIVGFKRVNGDVVEYSYENAHWFVGNIPCDSAQTFVEFDNTNLVEIYSE